MAWPSPLGRLPRVTPALLPPATESLDLDPWVWWVTIGVAAALLAFDVMWIARNPHRPSNRETGIALSIYVGAAILFGLGMWYFAGPTWRASSSRAGSRSTPSPSTTCSSSC